MQREHVSQGPGRSILARKRVQLLGALILAAFVPWAFRVLLLGELNEAAVTNALIGNVIAIMLAFWARLSAETYPGVRRSYIILPAALTSHGIVAGWFIFTRFPYDRLGLMLALFLHVFWLYFTYIRTEQQTTRRIAVVPFGGVEPLIGIERVQWRVLKRPRLTDAARCDAIVADFTADLPDQWEAFLAEAALAGCVVYQHKQLEESLTGRVRLEHLSENNFGSLVPVQSYFYLKAAADFIAALLVLPIVLPLLAVAAIAIRIDDGGPVLFKQRRIGYAGRPFEAYKFRTMRTAPIGGGENETRQALATNHDDPRITRVGAILRRHRIDELPQIFNILKGEMSWIGPRPEPEVLTRWFVDEVAFYHYRHVVKPGISGWAQVNQGYVSGVDGITSKLEYDFYYIKYFSLGIDILILFRTFVTLLTGSGAR